MGKKQKQVSNTPGKGSTTVPATAVPIMTGRGTIEIDPDIIYFTHSRVRPFFTGCNKRIEQTFEEIRQGVTSTDDIPLITVLYNEGCYFSLNNRRLYLWKWLKREGLLPTNTITAFLKPALEREKLKYTPSRCSLVAKLMKEHTKDNVKERSDVVGVEEEEEEEEGSDQDEDNEVHDIIDQQSSFESPQIKDEPAPAETSTFKENQSDEISEKKNKVVFTKTLNHFNLLSMDDDDDDESDEDSN